MKTFVISVILCISSISLNAQALKPLDEDVIYPKAEWMIGYSPFSLAANIFKFEVHRKFREGHYIGLQGGPLAGNTYTDDSNGPTQPVRGFYTKIAHKAYFPLRNEYFGFFIEHGPYLHRGTIPYTTLGWQSVTEDGLQVYKPVDVTEHYSSTRIGYDGSIGFSIFLDILYVDASVGLGYVSKISTGEAPAGYDLNNMIYGIDYQGIRLLGAIKFGYFF